MSSWSSRTRKAKAKAKSGNDGDDDDRRRLRENDDYHDDTTTAENDDDRDNRNDDDEDFGWYVGGNGGERRGNRRQQQRQHRQRLTVPTLLLDRSKLVENVCDMVSRHNTTSEVRLRHHCKTHQSSAVAGWVRDEQHRQSDGDGEAGGGDDDGEDDDETDSCWRCYCEEDGSERRGKDDAATAAASAAADVVVDFDGDDDGGGCRCCSTGITVSSVGMAEHFIIANNDDDDGIAGSERGRRGPKSSKTLRWKDVTVAFPFNLHEMKRVNDLLLFPRLLPSSESETECRRNGCRCRCSLRLGLVVENEEAIEYLARNLVRKRRRTTRRDDSEQHQQQPLLTTSSSSSPAAMRRPSSILRVWIKIDTGYRRTGVPFDDAERIGRLLQLINKRLVNVRNNVTTTTATDDGDDVRVRLAGFLVHAGHSYEARTPAHLSKVHHQTLSAVSSLRRSFQDRYPHLRYSIGDTPCCSTQDDYYPYVDEIRPGNFVFYDVEQSVIGSCGVDRIAVCLACPVVAKHPDRGVLVVYGGSVHLSKDSVVDPRTGETIYGLPVSIDRNTGEWGPPWPGNSRVVKLSQEHGIVRVTDDVPIMDKIRIGDFIGILPVHSCLAADCMGSYLLTKEGRWITDHYRVRAVSLSGDGAEGCTAKPCDEVEGNASPPRNTRTERIDYPPPARTLKGEAQVDKFLETLSLNKETGKRLSMQQLRDIVAFGELAEQAAVDREIIVVDGNNDSDDSN